MAKKETKQSWWKRISIGRAISIMMSLIILFFMIMIFGLFAAVIVGPVPTGNIAVIHIDGMITAQEGYGNFVFSSKIVEFIKKADQDSQIEAIMLDINSGGGSAVGSDEIAQAVKKANKTTIAVIREAGASGAYWIASSADIVYANRMSITGSIGVIGAYLEFDGLLEDYNITYRRMVSGKYKDIGSPFKEMTQEEQAMFQGMLDQIHEFFIEEVALNRNMTVEQVREISNGELFLGVKAKELGLVDRLGTKQDAVNFIEGEFNITADLADYKSRSGIADFLGTFSKNSLTESSSKLTLQT